MSRPIRRRGSASSWPSGSVCSCRNGTPAPIVERLNAEINKTLADPAIRENFLLAAQEPVGGSAEQFGRLFREDDIKYGRLVKELNMKLN